MCESLRNWQDLEKGEAARRLSLRLVEAAKQFSAADPGNPAAVYFSVGARFALASPEILSPRDPDDLCGRLDQMVEDLERAVPQATGTRHEENVRRLIADIQSARRAVPGCR